jgi:hypothetical protein
MNANEYYEKHNKFEEYSVVNLYKEDIIRLMENYSKYKVKDCKELKCKTKHDDLSIL